MLLRGILCAAIVLALPASAQSGGSWRGRSPLTGGTTDPTPLFQFKPSALTAKGSGVGNLTADAFSMTTAVLCDAKTATITSHVCTTGGTFVEADGDITVGYAAPLTDTAARSVDLDRFYSYEAPTTALAEVASGTDVRLRILAFVTDRGATQYLAGKYDTTNSQGYAIRVTAGGVVQGIANATTFGSYTVDAFGEWNLYELVCSVDTCSLYVNGYVTGSTGARSGTLATVTSARNFAIGCRSNGTNNDCIDGKVAWTKVETCASCVVNASVAAVAQRAAQEIQGVWPTHSVTAAPLSTDLRATRAMLDIDRDCDGVVRYFRVGPQWIRIAKRKAESTGGVCKIGYLGEPGVTNKVLHSHALDNAAWTDLTAADSVTPDLYFSPLSNVGTSIADMDRLVAASDAVGLEHGLRQAVTLTAAVHTISAIIAYDVGGFHKKFAFLRDNTIGATSIGFFDVVACKVLSQGAGLHYDANGYGPYAGARVQDLGTVSSIKFCRISITVMGTAASHNIDVGPADADNDTTFTTGAAVNLLGIGLVQVEAADDGYGATSYMPTAAAQATRNLDGLQFAIANFPTSGTLYTSVLYRDSKMANGSTGNVASYICVPYLNTNNYVLVKATASTGQGIRGGSCVTGSGGVYMGVLNAGVDQLESCAQGSAFGQWYSPATNLHDGQPHRARLVYGTNDFRGFVDGDQTAGINDSGGTVPTLTGGSILVGYESSTGTNQSAGLVEECTFYAVEHEPKSP